MPEPISSALSDRLYQTAAGPHWRKIGVRHHHGIAVPLFSLHSKQSCGIGEFLDLVPLIDGAAAIGMNVIQLLPLNDSGPDSSPYSAISALALHPIYLSLSGLPGLDARALQVLNQSKRVDYPNVLATKDAFLREHYSEQIRAYQDCQDFQKYIATNPWVRTYALFKTLKEKYKWRSWRRWPARLRDPSAETLQELYREHCEEVDYHSVVQYFCNQQLNQVKEFAEKRGVLLKGDIPILVSPESADVWAERALFDISLSAGAPPDMYSAGGQNWGFPLFNWDALAAEDYSWWRRRLTVAEQYYHLYRLDHVVGFFRIWGIPRGKAATEGQFYPEDSNVWVEHGRRILQMLLNTSTMLPIGEDLGTIPPEVRNCLREMGIPGTKVLRWERRWDHDGGYIEPSDYPAESMTTISTHDSETLQHWWSLRKEEAQTFCNYKGWKYKTKLTATQHAEILRDSHQSGSLFHINLLQEYLALVPEAHWERPQDDRVNRPGRVSKRNWTFRYKPSIEEIRSNSALREVIQAAIG